MNGTGKSLWMRIYNGATTALVALVALAAMALVGVRAVGLTPYAILSGSMEPAYGVGDLIYVRRADPADIRVGDPITFVLNEDLVVATHRVIKIDPLNHLFYTKGDANEAADGAPVHFNNLLGKPVFAIPALGYLSSYIAQPPGAYVAICAGAALLLLLILPDLLSAADRADQKTAQKRKKAAALYEDEAGAGYDPDEYDGAQPYDPGEYDDTQPYDPVEYAGETPYGAAEYDGWETDDDSESSGEPDESGAAAYDGVEDAGPAQDDACWYVESDDSDGDWDRETDGAYPDVDPDHAADSKPQAPWYRRLWPK